MRRASHTTLFLTAVLAACASSGGGGGSGGGDRNLISTRRQLLASNQRQVQRLRPQWLRSRGGEVTDLPATFVDGRHFGDISQLSAFSTADILAIRYLSASDATTLYGTGYPGGVIEIQTR